MYTVDLLLFIVTHRPVLLLGYYGVRYCVSGCRPPALHEAMVSRASNIEAVNRQLDIGSQGSELHAVIKARQWAGAASLINGAHPHP